MRSSIKKKLTFKADATFMLTDSHCHLGSERFSPEEIPDIIERARCQSVTRLITLATDEQDQARNLTLAETYPEVHACLGIHPCDVHETRDEFEELLRPHLGNPKVAAVGETGLDYFHPAPEGWTEEAYHGRQKDFLVRHFELAKEFGLNVVIHTRDRKGHASFEDAIEVYERYNNEVRAVFHCFPGPHALAQRIYDLGGLVSFTGIVTFKNAQPVVESALKAPPQSFMLETDSRFLAPEPYRGKRCEPGYVSLTAAKIAELRGISLEDLALNTEKAVQQFFRLS